jgi:hypothetical protein
VDFQKLTSKRKSRGPTVSDMLMAFVGFYCGELENQFETVSLLGKIDLSGV